MQVSQTIEMAEMKDKELLKTYIEICRSYFYAKKLKKLSKNYCILVSYHIKYGQSGTKWRKVE